MGDIVGDVRLGIRDRTRGGETVPRGIVGVATPFTEEPLPQPEQAGYPQ
jgi:hypothetical protein